VDVRGAVHAEWFGFKGDGSTGDTDRLQLCLTKLGRVRLLAKTYVITAQVTLSTGYVIEGQGMDKTKIVFQAADVGNFMPAFNVAFGIGTPPPPIPADNVVIRDLTIDCYHTRAGSTSTVTRGAIQVYGANFRVERVKAVNFGVGTSTLTQECFVIIAYGWGSSRALGTIQDCVVTQPGTHTSVPGSIAEITCLGLGGQGSASDTLGLGGRILRNRVLDIPYIVSQGPYQPSTPHAITISNCIGTEIADNEIINCDGVGVYVGSWTDENLVIRNNRMIGINMGVALGIAPWPVNTPAPNHSGTKILENLIDLGVNKGLPPDTGLTGVSFYIAGLTGVTTTLLKDIYVQRNFIRGQKVTGVDYIPVGVDMNLNTMIFENIRIEDNTLEIPDPDDRSVLIGGVSYPYGFNAGYENCIVYWPSSNYYTDNHGVFPPPVRAWSKIKVHGNRNLAGTDVRLKVYEAPGEDANHNPISPPGFFWGPFSQRKARFKAPNFSRRAVVLYDEFIGSLPRSALGWTSVLANGGSLGEGTAYDHAPGVISLNTGTAADGQATLRLPNAPFVFASGAGVAQIVEFRAARSAGNAPGEDYDYALGLRKSDETDAIWFRASGQDTGEAFYAYTRLAGNDVFVGQSNMKSWGPSDPGNWFTFRIELVPNPTPEISLEARFFLNWRWIGSARNDVAGGGVTQVPTGPLEFAFKVHRLPVGIPTVSRSLLVDYFQHQVVRL
jgi:hypothetical protein